MFQFLRVQTLLNTHALATLLRAPSAARHRSRRSPPRPRARRSSARTPRPASPIQDLRWSPSTSGFSHRLFFHFLLVIRVYCISLHSFVTILQLYCNFSANAQTSFDFTVRPGKRLKKLWRRNYCKLSNFPSTYSFRTSSVFSIVQSYCNFSANSFWLYCKT